MSSIHYQKVCEIFQQSIELEGEEREQFLRQQCGDNKELRDQVEAMLEQDQLVEDGHAEDDIRIHVDLEGLDSLSALAGQEVKAPEEVDGFKILEELGQGGMGVVYKALQSSPHRHVAIKLLKPEYSSAKMLKRFESEVEALGRLDHPGIARIFHAGIALVDGLKRPYFVMELIEGKQLLEALEAAGASTENRLAKLAEIADAVQHAHQRGVIHRDLKPSNILLDQNGMVKVLDFGVARILGEVEEELKTQTGQVLGTLAYMSPEQVNSGPDTVDTRSDVYALGVVGMEMLCGKLPLNLKGLSITDSLKRLGENERPRLSSFASELKGDPDCIIGKALSLEPADRYSSCAELAADIRRSLKHEAILAKAPSTLDQLFRFAKRRRALVISVLCIFMALVVGLISTLVALDQAKKSEQLALQEGKRAKEAKIEALGYLEQERSARRKAELETSKATKIANLIEDLLASSDPRVAKNKDLYVRDLLDRFEGHIQKLDEPEVEANLRYVVGRSFHSLSLHKKAVKQFLKARDLFLSDVVKSMGEAYMCQSYVASCYRQLGELDKATEHYLEAESGLSNEYGKEDKRAISALNNLAMLYYSLGENALARDSWQELYTRSCKSLGPLSSQSLSIAHNLAGIELRLGQLSRAETLLVEVVAGKEEKYGADHMSTLSSLSMLAGTRRRLGRYKEAVESFRDLVKRKEKLFDSDHKDLIIEKHNLASTLVSLGQTEEAMELEKSILDQLSESREATDPQLQSVRLSYALMLSEDKQFAASKEIVIKVHEARKAQLGSKSATTQKAAVRLASLNCKLGNLDQAQEQFEKAIEVFTEKLGASHLYTLNTRSHMAELFEEKAELEKAAKEVESVKQLALEGLPKEDWNRGYFCIFAANYYERQGLKEKSRENLELALNIYIDTLGKDHRSTEKLIRQLSECLKKLKANSALEQLRAQYPEAFNNPST